MAILVPKDHVAVSAAAMAAVPATATEAEDGSLPPWRADDESGQLFTHLQSTILHQHRARITWEEHAARTSWPSSTSTSGERSLARTGSLLVDNRPYSSQMFPPECRQLLFLKCRCP